MLVLSEVFMWYAVEPEKGLPEVGRKFKPPGGNGAGGGAGETPQTSSH